MIKRLIAAGVSILILGLILANVDRSALLDQFSSLRPIPFALAMLMFIPQMATIIYRWRRIANPFTPMPMGEATRLVLAGASMNIILPSKLGDMTKAVFLHRSGALELTPALHLVVFEKMLDMGALCLLALAGALISFFVPLGPDDSQFAMLRFITICFCGGIVALVAFIYYRPAKSADKPSPELSGKIQKFIRQGEETINLLRSHKVSRPWLTLCSLLIWFLHLLQIYFFFLCFETSPGWLPFAALMPLAIFVGLLPISLFGIGTRDAAILYLFSACAAQPVLVGVGLLFNLRYLIPALAGLPFLTRYLALSKQPRPQDP